MGACLLPVGSLRYSGGRLSKVSWVEGEWWEEEPKEWRECAWAEGGYLPAFPSQTNQAQHRAEGIEAPSPNHARRLTEVVTREKEGEREHGRA